MTVPSVILIYDQPWLAKMKDGQPPLAALSHDQMLFQFGHESLRKGFDVYLEVSHEARRPAQPIKVEQFFPIMKLRDVIDAHPIAPTFVVLTYPHSLYLREQYPTAKIIGILPAMNMFEYPERPSAGWVYDFMTAARTQIDYYITQNVRMAEIARCLFRFIARTELKDRILVCPLGIIEEQRQELPSREIIRKEMGLFENQVAFINAGGPWSWTDYNTFLRAFCNVVRDGTTHIKFYILGFKQPENPEHEESVAEAKAIIAENSDLVGRNLIVIQDWYEASVKAYAYTNAADVGVNVTKDSIENWQSYRLRFLEYMKAGIPVIHTTGDDLSTHDAVDAVYPVEAAHIASYESAIRLAANNTELRQKKAEAMRRCAANYDSRNTYGRVINRLIELPGRDFSNPREVFEPSLFVQPKPIPTFWRRRFWAKKWKKQIGALSIIPEWCDGMGPVMHRIEPMHAYATTMSISFKPKIFEDIRSNWVEIIQLGDHPERSRAIIYAVHIAPGFYRLVLRIFDAQGRSQQLVTPDIQVMREVNFSCQFLRKKGQVNIFLNGRVYESAILLPWDWIDIDQIWLGSRRLPGIIRDIKIGI